MKHYYTKIRKLLQDSSVLHVQATDNDVFLCEGHMIVRMPDWLYREHFVDATEGEYRCTFPIVMNNEKLTVKDGEVSENGPDLTQAWHDLFEEHCKYMARPAAEPFRHGVDGRRYVRFVDTETDRVLINNRFYEAVDQATRGGLRYGDTRRSPVWFYDCDQIYRSAFCGCVLPILYHDWQVEAL